MKGRYRKAGDGGRRQRMALRKKGGEVDVEDQIERQSGSGAVRQVESGVGRGGGRTHFAGAKGKDSLKPVAFHEEIGRAHV